MNVFNQPFTLMGIVNVTPDSFYDGGLFASTERAVNHGLRLAGEGAHILDIGGASTKPGAADVAAGEELRRVMPVIEELAKKPGIPISVDTSSSVVARAAIDAGATWINDVSAGRHDPRMKQIAAESGCKVVLMHSRGTPKTMQQLTTYNDVISDVKSDLLAAVKEFCDAGVARQNIVIDPGIGFAKTPEQNITLLRGLAVLLETGLPVLIGTSRKSFIGHITGRAVEDRLAGTLGSVATAYVQGVRLFRVHDVAATRDFLSVLGTIQAPTIGSTR
jgi:dihydropteroate synthase